MRVAIVASAVLMSLMGTTWASESQPAIRQATHIQAQALGTALRALAKERGLQILVSSDVIRQVRTEGAVGELTIDEALRRLLGGTGLTYSYLDAQTVTVVRAESVGTSGASTPSGNLDSGDWAMVKLAQMEQPTYPDNQAQQPIETEQKGGGKIEEIVVTAQKREERLQDVPISMSVLSGEDLDSSTVRDVTEALSRLPGVSINEFFIGGGAQIPLRGVAAGLPLFTGSSPTAYYLDSVPFGFVKTAIGPNPDAYDLERIEVLRGPQGTLYGASALNGVVRVLTNDANPDRFEFKARTSASSTKLGGENYRGDVVFNMPIIAGKLAARAVVGYQDLSGWIDKPIGKDANDVERRNMRLKVNAQPTEQLSIGLSAWLSRTDDGAGAKGLDDDTSPSWVDESMLADYDAYGLKVNYELPWFVATSMTSYLNYANDSILDLTASSTAPLVQDTHLRAQTFAQEITLNSVRGESWRWTLGGMYRDSEDALAFFIPGLTAAPGSDENHSRSYAIFGELTRLLLQGKLEVTAGLRHFEDDVALQELSRFNGAPSNQLISSEARFDSTVPRLALAWHPREQLTVYASYSEGYRSGYDQSPSVLTAAPGFPSAKPDTLTNYELGSKGSFLGGRLNFDTALFYMDWQDVQQSLVIPYEGLNLAAIVNGVSASGMGVEFAVTARPIEALEIGANASWNDLTMDEDVLSRGIVLFNKGDRSHFSPRYTIGTSADYTFSLGASGFEGRLSASANYTAKQETRALCGVCPGGVRISSGDDMLIARTSIAVFSPNHWTITLFADNVNNERSVPVRTETIGPARWNIRTRPRTVGLQVEFSY